MSRTLASLVRLAMVAAWVFAWWQAVGYLSAHTFGWGPWTFPVWLLLAGGLGSVGVGARAFDIPRPGHRAVRAITAIASLGAVLLLLRAIAVFPTFLSNPHAQTHLVDIGANTLAADRLILEGRNPYEGPAQLKHRLTPGGPIVVSGEDTTVFGVPYHYGFPYWPVMALGYLPWATAVEGVHAMRWANAFFALLSLGLATRLAARLSPGGVGLAVSLTALVYLANDDMSLGPLFMGDADVLLGLLGVATATFAVEGRVSAAAIAGGLSQAAKILPAPFLGVAAWRLTATEGRRRGAATYAAVSLAFLLPFVLLNPAAFLSSTLLYYLAHHRDGDDSAIYPYLPNALRAAWPGIGLVLSAMLALAPARTPLAVLRWTSAAWLVFIAFGKMAHLNYLHAIWPLLAAVAGAGLARWIAPDGDQPRYTK